MKQEVISAQERALIRKMLLEILRQLSIEYQGSDKLGRYADEVVLHASVFIGQAEGRPMNASKLADYCGISRPTALRKLKSMVQRGLLRRDDDGFYYVPADRMNKQSALRAFARVKRTVVQSVDELDRVSKMNSGKIAAR